MMKNVGCPTTDAKICPGGRGVVKEFWAGKCHQICMLDHSTYIDYTTVLING